MVIFPGLWTQRANPQLFLRAWSPKWSPDWPTWVQKGSHFEAQKWQILVVICAWRLYGQNLASCWHVLLGCWAPGANPQLCLRAWSPKWSPDWPTWAQKGSHSEAPKVADSHGGFALGGHMRTWHHVGISCLAFGLQELIPSCF